MANRSVKRSISIWVLVAMLLAAVALSGCGGQEETPTEPNEPEAATAST